MHNVEQMELLRNEANAYKLLSLLYYTPTAEIINILALLKETVENLSPDLVPLVQEMEGQANQDLPDLMDLIIEHTKLFVGPFDLLVAPYSSVYLDGQRRVMGESTMQVLALYREAGLAMESDFKQLPDHIAVEFEFMYYLLAKHLETHEEQWLERKCNFVANHMGEWVAKFSDTLMARALSVFYKNLGVLTLSLLIKLNTPGEAVDQSL